MVQEAAQYRTARDGSQHSNLSNIPGSPKDFDNLMIESLRISTS